MSSKLEQLRDKRTNLQMLQSGLEIGVAGAATIGVVSVGVWLGSFVSKMPARIIAQSFFGLNLTLVGGGWMAHQFTNRKLNKNWDDIEDLKHEIQANGVTKRCPRCKFYNPNSTVHLGCAVNPDMPADCSDFESNQVFEFQDSSGINVVVEGCEESEIEDIKQIVHRVFNS